MQNFFGPPKNGLSRTGLSRTGLSRTGLTRIGLSRTGLSRASSFNHGLSEFCITDERIVNTQELSFLALLLELIRDEVCVIPFFLSVAVAVGSSFLM